MKSFFYKVEITQSKKVFIKIDVDTDSGSLSVLEKNFREELEKEYEGHVVCPLSHQEYLEEKK